MFAFPSDAFVTLKDFDGSLWLSYLEEPFSDHRRSVSPARSWQRIAIPSASPDPDMSGTCAAQNPLDCLSLRRKGGSFTNSAKISLSARLTLRSARRHSTHS